jgi:hypothetical protein
MNTDERILNKIKKCLALSQSPEPAEAAAALRQAQKLMEMHGVTQADLSRVELGEARVKSKVSVSRPKDWEVQLLNLVAKAFGCKLLWTKSSSSSVDAYGRYVLIGLKVQVQLASYTADVLQRKLIKARGKFVNELSPYMTRGQKTVQADGFCHGWVMAISKTVHEFALNDETKELIDACVSGLSDGPAEVQERRAGTMGLNAGFEAGSSESIHRPVGDREPTLRLT